MDRTTDRTHSPIYTSRSPHYRPGSSTKYGEFVIPTICLSPSDRRLLSSTVESVLSKDEESALLTICFFRDVLLADFLPETFIQESSLSQGLVQAVKETWQDPMVNYVAFQVLMKLSSSLSGRIGYADSTEFYQPNDSNKIPTVPPTHRSGEEDFLSGTDYSERRSNTEYFLNNFIKFLSGLSRAVSYMPSDIHLWVLLERYSSLTEKYLHHFTFSNPKTLYMNIEEILLDISQCFLHNPNQVNPVIVATVMSTLLSNFDISEGLVLTTDVRRAIWGLASNTRLAQTPYTFVRNYFMEKAAPFERDLKSTLDLNGNDASVDAVRSASWWKLGMIKDQKIWKENVAEAEIVPQTLFKIQNSVEHVGVFGGINQLWENLLPLIFNSRLMEPVDGHLIPPHSQWRESFYRFLSVEPSTTQDEALLIHTLDVLSFLIRSMNDSRKIRSWAVPLVSEKSAALLRLALDESSATIASPKATNISTLNFSIFGFFASIIDEGSDSNQLGEFFNVCTEILKVSSEAGFPCTAILVPVLKSISHLISLDLIQEKLKENPVVTVSLLEITSDCVQSLCERMGDASYRNWGGIRYGGFVLMHLSNILGNDHSVSPVWIFHCIPVITFLSNIENPLIKASALQICVNVMRSERGTFALISRLESPTFLWRLAFTRLTDSAEASIVKQRSATVLLNLINDWDQMKELLGSHVEVPRVKLLEEFSLLLTNVSWNPRLSDSKSSESRFNGDCAGSGSGDKSSILPFITPTVFSLCSKIVMKLVDCSHTHQMQLITENLSLMRDLCIALIRIIGTFDTKSMDEGCHEVWMKQTLISIGHGVSALISIVELDRTFSLILIADRQNLSNIISFFNVPSKEGDPTWSCALSALWRNVFILLTIITESSGQNIQDLERLFWSQRSHLFPSLIKWLDMRAQVTDRKVAIDFLSTLLLVAYGRFVDGHSSDFLEQVWMDTEETLGIVICKKLLEVLDHSLESREGSSILYCLNHLVLLSSTANGYAVKNQVVKKLGKGLRQLGTKRWNFNSKNKKIGKSVDLIKWHLIVLTTLFNTSCGEEAKQQALLGYLPQSLHIIFKYAQTLADQTLLHALIHCLINFTAEFSEGSLSLAVTSGMFGVSSKKMPSSNSLYTELLLILVSELETVDKNPNISCLTIEILFSFIKNSSFNIECRNLLAKGKLLNFLTKFHPTEMKKWSIKYPELKIMFLKTLLQLTLHQDMQQFISKIPESTSILVTLSENESDPTSMLALQVLRNLCFNAANRPRLLCEPLFLSTLASRLSRSEDFEKLEVAGVALWALTANSEKGKVSAKLAGCTAMLNSTIQRLKIKQNALALGDPSVPALSAVIQLLEKVASIQASTKDGDVGYCLNVI